MGEERQRVYGSSTLTMTRAEMELSRLRGRKICDALLRKGRLWKGKHLMIRWLSGAPRHPAADPARRAVYAGTLASRKLDKSAVKRNRMRRRCREALRVALKESEIHGTAQLLLLPRSSSLTCAFVEIQADIAQFLRLLPQR